MDAELQSCSSRSTQTSGMDDSEGFKYRDGLGTMQSSVRPGRGGYCVDSILSFSSKGRPLSIAHNRPPPFPPSYVAYGWEHPPLSASGVGIRSTGGVDRAPMQYMDNHHEHYNSPYSRYRNYNSFQGRMIYEGFGYHSEM
jgi:hypothetical protein